MSLPTCQNVLSPTQDYTSTEKHQSMKHHNFFRKFPANRINLQNKPENAISRHRNEIAAMFGNGVKLT